MWHVMWHGLGAHSRYPARQAGFPIRPGKGGSFTEVVHQGASVKSNTRRAMETDSARFGTRVSGNLFTPACISVPARVVERLSARKGEKGKYHAKPTAQ